MKDKKTIIHMVTSSSSMSLMRGQLKYLVDLGYDVRVITSKGSNIQSTIERENIIVKEINMERTISPIKDLISLIKIIFYFIKVRPDICNAGTPKAGLLGMIAAKLTGVKFKVYTNRGTPFEGSSGIKRKILVFTEKIACFCADKVICISPSIQTVLLENNIVKKEKTITFGKGSSNGLLFKRFHYNEEVENEIIDIKEKYALDKFDFIIGSVGRINNFKGTTETVLAFEKLQKKYNNIALLLVGGIEKKDSISRDIEMKIENNPNIIHVGKVPNPTPYYHIIDVLSFPSHREGFGNVSIESQYCKTPVVVADVTGSKDTLIKGVTGFIVPKGDEQELSKQLEKFILDPQLKKEMGIKGHKWVKENFESQFIWESLKELYEGSFGS